MSNRCGTCGQPRNAWETIEAVVAALRERGTVNARDLPEVKRAIDAAFEAIGLADKVLAAQEPEQREARRHLAAAFKALTSGVLPASRRSHDHD